STTEDPARAVSPTPYRVELWDVAQRKLIRQIDRHVDPGLRPWVWWDRDSFYLSGGPAQGPRTGPAGRDADPALPPSRYDWSDGRELPPPAETLVTYLEPPPRFPYSSYTFDSYVRDLEVFQGGGALWRGRDGLLLQIGWEPGRMALAESG